MHLQSVGTGKIDWCVLLLHTALDVLRLFCLSVCPFVCIHGAVRTRYQFRLFAGFVVACTFGVPQSDLCDAIFAFDWVGLGTSTSRQCFSFLLVNLVSANSCFLLPAFRVLIGCFTHDAVAGVGVVVGPETNSHSSSAPAAAAAGSGSGASQPQSQSQPGHGIATDEFDLDLVHAVIGRIVLLVPRSIGVLARVLNDQFPHKSQPVELQVSE